VVRLPQNISTVVDLFDTKGISWKEYMEDVPGPGYMGGISLNAKGKPDYVRKHKYVVVTGYLFLGGFGKMLMCGLAR
jgi:acid phosphatase